MNKKIYEMKINKMINVDIAKTKRLLLEKAVKDFGKPKYYTANYYNGSYFGIPLGNIFIAHSKAEAVYLLNCYIDDHPRINSDNHESFFEEINEQIDYQIEEEADDQGIEEEANDQGIEEKADDIEDILDDAIDVAFENDTLWLSEYIPY